MRFSDFLLRAGADTTAKYVALHCADNYWTSIDMPTALHPQTLLTLTYDGSLRPAKYGFPFKLRIPTKLGYKNPQHIVAIILTGCLKQTDFFVLRHDGGDKVVDLHAWRVVPVT